MNNLKLMPEQNVCVYVVVSHIFLWESFFLAFFIQM